MSQKPMRDDLEIRQGAQFVDQLTCQDADGVAVDLTGCSAVMQIRAHPKAPAPLIELSTDNGRLVLGGAAGTIRRTITDEEADSLPAGAWSYDLFLTWPDGSTDCLAFGDAVVPPRYTRTT